MWFADELLDLALGGRCAGCDRAGRAWCKGCAETLHNAVRAATVDPPPPGMPPTLAAAGYDGAVRRAIIAHKERRRAALARPLGVALARAVIEVVERAQDPGLGGVDRRRPVVLVPVPTTPAAVRRRGYDPLGRIARVAVRTLRRNGHPAELWSPLRPVRAVADQATLGVAARQANLRGAFTVEPDSRGGRRAGTLGWPGTRRPVGSSRSSETSDVPVVIVDDVTTSGATLTEAARALTVAGIEVIGAATIASTARRAPGLPSGPGTS